MSPLGFRPLGFLLLTLTSFAWSSGADRCSWGPAYWCQTLPQSRECSATSHCIEQVWKGQTFPQKDNDEVCKICLDMVRQARDTLNSNETLSELQQVFEGSCDLIPLRVIADECKKLSDQFLVELVEMLTSEMDPNVVCATAGLCYSARVDKMLELYHEFGHEVRTECDVCKEQSAQIADKIKSFTKRDIEDKLLEICGYLGSYSDACKATVVSDFDVIVHLLDDIGRGAICDLVGLCSETFANSPAQYTSTSKEDIQCEFCEKVIQHWVDVWTANTTVEEFKEVLEGLCHRLDSADRVQHCLHIVDDFYLPWFKFLIHEVNPKQICTLVGLCGSNGVFQVDPRSSISLLLTPKGHTVDMTPIQSAIDPEQGLIGGYFVPQTELALTKPGCVICEYALHELQNWLGNEKTEEKVEAGVRHLCNRMPEAVKDQCVNFVSTYGPAIVQLIIHDIDPAEICPRLRLCEDDLLEQQFSESTPELQMFRRSQDSCALCEYGLTMVYSMLNDTTNQEEVKNVLDSICYKIPNEGIRNECQKMVAQYTNMIIDLILESYTPDEICSKLDLCQKAQVELTKGDQECVLCQYVISTLDKMIADKHNEEEVRHALEKLCGYLPKSITDKCTNFVDQYSDMIIDLIAHDLTPEQICEELQLCDSDDTLNDLTNSDSIPNSVSSDVDNDNVCTLCEYVIGEIDKMAEDKKNEDKVRRALEGVCNMFGAQVRKECLQMVDDYTAKIIDMFVAEFTPEEICKELQMCKAKINNQIYISNDISGNGLAQEPPIPDDSELSLTSTDKPFCVLCEFVLSMEQRVLTNRTLDMSKRFLQMACSYLPNEKVAQKCEEFVDDYGDQIIKLIIEEEMAPKEVCTEMQLCTGPNAHMEALARCVWGPSFWCQSRFHAQVCGTLRHCQNTVWNK